MTFKFILCASKEKTDTGLEPVTERLNDDRMIIFIESFPLTLASLQSFLFKQTPDIYFKVVLLFSVAMHA